MSVTPKPSMKDETAVNTGKADWAGKDAAVLSAALLAMPFNACATASAMMLAAAGQAAGFWLQSVGGALGVKGRAPAEHGPAADSLEFLAYSATPEGPLEGDAAPVKKARAKAAKPKDVAVKEASAESLLMPEDFRQPASMEKPANPDDLKRIIGIGPKLEQVLNGLGVWTFAQIAAWGAPETAWADDYLQFPGRIARDGWVKQAKTLAGA